MSRWRGVIRTPYTFSLGLSVSANLVFLLAGLFAFRALESFDGPLTDLTNRIFLASYGLWLVAIGCALFGRSFAPSSDSQGSPKEQMVVSGLFLTALLAVFVPGLVCSCAPNGLSVFVYPHDYVSPFVWILPNLLATLGFVSAALFGRPHTRGWPLLGGLVWNVVTGIVAITYASLAGDGYYGTIHAFTLPGMNVVGYCLIGVVLMGRGTSPAARAPV